MPRLSLIIAIVSQGQLFASMLQSNTDSVNFSMFMRHLAKVLDKKDPNWRENTIITMDEAAYNMSSESLQT